MFRRFFSSFHSQAKTITSAAVIIATATLTAKLLGVLRDRVLAGQFGAGRELDIYYASFRIPDLVFNLFVLGTLSAGFIPVFQAYLKKDTGEAWKLVNVVLTLLFVSLTVVCAILMVATPWLMRFLTPGFSAGDLEATIRITRIMFLSPLILGISGVMGGVLQSFKLFFVYSIAPIAYNLGIIFGALFLTPVWGIEGLAWGVVLGAVMHVMIQLPSVVALGLKPRWRWQPKHPGMLEIVGLMIPRVLGLAVSQLHFLVITIIGSTLSVGSIAIFNLSNNLQSVPLGLFGLSFAIAAFPTLSELADKKPAFIENFSLTLRQILFFVIPSSALLILLRAQIVRAVLGSGLFDWKDTILTMYTLAFFALSLFAQSLTHLITRAFYAQKDSTTPFVIGLVSAVANIILSLVMVHAWSFFQPYLLYPLSRATFIQLNGSEVVGLAFAFSISNIMNLLLLWIVLRAKMGDLDEQTIAVSVVKISAAALVMATVIQLLKYAIEPFFGTTTFLGVALQGGLSAAIGIGVYFSLCLLLRSPEARLFFASMQKRFAKHVPPLESIEDQH